MDSLNVHAYSLYKLLQLTYVCYTLKTIISDTSEVNVTKTSCTEYFWIRDSTAMCIFIVISPFGSVSFRHVRDR